ncbi:MAG: transglycosylase SLT domain-containing protein [Patescibacteria group bacterium]|jgi:hypothetical protein
MKNFFFPALLFLLILFFLPAQAAEAGCCVCGDLNDPSSIKYLLNVTDCSGCTVPNPIYDKTNGLCKDDKNCCVTTEKVSQKVKACDSYTTPEMCKTEEISIDKKEYFDTKCSDTLQCSYIGSVYQQPKKDVVVKFKPQITIPGSKFIAGQEVQITFNTLGEYITAIYVFLVGVAGILASVMIIFGGIQYVVSFGSPDKISKAKDTIVSAMIGLALALGSYAILVTISPRLVEFTTLEVGEITAGKFLETEGQGAKGAVAVAWSGKDVNIIKYKVNGVEREISVNDLIAKAASDYGVPRNWMKAIMLVESNGNPDAVSASKACGLMQLLPATAQRFVKDKSIMTCERLKDPATNIDYAGRYLEELIKYTCPTSANYKSGKKAVCKPEESKCVNGVFDPWVSAAYNGGLGANCSSITCKGLTWWECIGNPGYNETRAYVQKVKSAYDKIVANAW